MISSETHFVTCLLERFTLELTRTYLAIGTRAIDSATTESTPMRVMIAETVAILRGSFSQRECVM